MVRATRALRTWALLSCVTACSTVLDIQDAHVDSTLGASGSVSAAGSSSQGGTSAGSSTTAGKSSETAGSSQNNSEAGQDNTHLGEAGAGGAPEPEASLCERYCDLVIASCSGQLEQYRTLGQCLQVCELLPAGSPGDEHLNTVECRLRQAKFAEAEPLSYCKSSGPLGEDKCGSNCVGYCSLMQSSCTPASTAGNLELSYFVDEDSCLAACDAIEPDPGSPVAYSSSPTAQPSSYVGNNLYCRVYHVAAGLEQAAEDEHCPHAMGGEPCTTE
jgi:hypothetical protein